MIAVLLLIGLFALTSFTRLWLKLPFRHQANLNGSPERFAQAIFFHFVGAGKMEIDAQGELKKHSRLQQDIHISVVESETKPDSHCLLWTRGPLPDGVSPAAQVSANEISLLDEIA